MNIYPKKIQIGGKTINVVIDANIESWGEYHADKGEIKLSLRCLGSKTMLRDTLRHEMIHAALDISGLSFLKNYEEEAIVRGLEHILLPALDSIAKQLPKT